MAKYSLHSRVRSALRRVWYWSPARREAVKAARVSPGQYKCAGCGRVVKDREYAVDHVEACGSLSPSLEEIGEFSYRLFFGQLQVLCKQPCHLEKTREERRKRGKRTSGVAVNMPSPRKR